MQPLWAATDEQTAGMIGLAVLAGQGIQWLAGWVGTQLEKRRARLDKDRTDDRKEKSEEEEKLDQQRDKLWQRFEASEKKCMEVQNQQQVEINDLRKAQMSLAITNARLVGRVESLETILRANKIEVPPDSSAARAP